MTEKPISRREFIIATGVAAGAALVACNPKVEQIIVATGKPAESSKAPGETPLSISELSEKYSGQVLFISTIALAPGQGLIPTAADMTIKAITLETGLTGFAIIADVGLIFDPGVTQQVFEKDMQSYMLFRTPIYNNKSEIIGYRPLTDIELALGRANRLAYVRQQVNEQGVTELVQGKDKVLAKVQNSDISSNQLNNADNMPTPNPTLTAGEKKILRNVKETSEEEIKAINETYLKNSPNLKKFLEKYNGQIRVQRTFSEKKEDEELIPYVILKDIKDKPQKDVLRELFEAAKLDKKDIVLQVGSGSSAHPQPAQQAVTRENTIVIAIDPDPNAFGSASRNDWEPLISRGPKSGSAAFHLQMRLADIPQDIKFKEIFIAAPSPKANQFVELPAESILKLTPDGKITVIFDPYAEMIKTPEQIRQEIMKQYPEATITMGKFPDPEVLRDQFGITSFYFNGSLGLKGDLYRNLNYTEINYMIIYGPAGTTIGPSK